MKKVLCTIVLALSILLIFTINFKVIEQLIQCKNKTEELDKKEIEELIKTTLITGDE